MKDYRDAEIKNNDKCILIHRLINEKDIIVVTVTPYDGKSIAGEKEAVSRKFQNIAYYKTVFITSKFLPKHVKKYCPQNKLMKIPDDIVENNDAILAFVRLAGFEYDRDNV